MGNVENVIEEIQEDTQKDKYLIFCIDNEEYGIEIKYVIEIIGIQTIATVPDLEEYIKGVINLRGKIIPVMDVRCRFKKAERNYDDRTCIIVIEIEDISIGLIVDRVSEVANIQEDQIAPPPEFKKGTQNRYIKGIGKTGENVKLMLDCDRLLNDETIEGLGDIAR